MTQSGPADDGSPCIFPFTLNGDDGPFGPYSKCLDYDAADAYLYENYEELYDEYWDKNWAGTWFGKWCSTQVHVLCILSEACTHFFKIFPGGQ